MKRICAFVALCFCAACGDSGSTATADMAAGGADMARMLPAPYVGASMTPAALDCIGSRMDPAAPSQDTVVSGVIKDFQNSYPVKGATVSVYFDASQVVAKQPVASSTSSDEMGNFTITVPKGHYRVIWGNTGGKAITSSGSMQDTIDAYEFGVAFDDKQRAAVTTSTRDAIPGLVNVIPDPSLGVLAGSVRDCTKATVGGAVVEVTMTSAAWDAASLTFYFKNIGGQTLPLLSQHWTSDVGLFAALNVPPGTATETAQVELNGKLTTVGTNSIPVIAGAITIADILPASK